MKIFDVFKLIGDRFSNKFEKKSLPQNLLNFELNNNDNYNLSMTLSLVYYASISNLSTAIDIIADEFQSIDPLILNLETKEFNEDNDLINLLKFPNSDQTKTELFGSMVRFFKITGNAFLIATGNINRPPLELISINPMYLSIKQSDKDNFAESYIYQSKKLNIVFNRIEEKSRFRYVNEEKDLELWHIRNFNPEVTSSSVWGFSLLNSIYLELLQFLSSNKHNLSLLKKGIRASGVLTTESRLNQDQRDNLREQLQSDNMGDTNAGYLFLLDGGKFDFKELSQNLKDMDFRELKNDLSLSIYNRLKIPLPLINTKNQKFDNIREAKLSLYDNTIIPTIKYLFNELSLFLFPRFGIDPKKNELWFNFFMVQVLKQRYVEETLNLFDKKTITLNETRTRLHLDKIEGGDIIYVPNNLIPMGTNNIGTNNIDQNSQKKSLFNNTLRNIKYKNGKSVYDEEI